jgi:uncharacterized protein DUF6459
MSAVPLSYQSAATASLPLAPCGRASIRVCPVPRAEPPTEDEMCEAGWDPPGSGTPLLPLDLPRRVAPGRSGREARQDVRPDARTGGTALAVADAGGADQPGERHGPPSAARTATRVFLATCLEIVGGYRPIAHLRPFCRPEHFLDIANQVTGQAPSGRFRGRAYGAVRAPGPSTLTPPRSVGAARNSPTQRIYPRRVQTSEAVAGAIEVAVVLTRNEQVWAMAFRLEEWRGRWLCSCLEML